MAVSLHFSETTEEKIGEQTFTIGVLPNHKKAQLMNRYLRFSKKARALVETQEKVRAEYAEEAGAKQELIDLIKAADSGDAERIKEAEDLFRSRFDAKRWAAMESELEDINFDISELMFSDECMKVYFDLLREGLRKWSGVYAIRSGKKSEVKFSTDDETLGLLDLAVVRDLANKIINFNSLSEEEQGN